MIAIVKPTTRLSAQFERKGHIRDYPPQIALQSESDDCATQQANIPIIIAETKNKPAWRGHHMDIWI